MSLDEDSVHAGHEVLVKPGQNEMLFSYQNDHKQNDMPPSCLYMK